MFCIHRRFIRPRIRILLWSRYQKNHHYCKMNKNIKIMIMIDKFIPLCFCEMCSSREWNLNRNKKGDNIEGAEETVCANFKNALERCSFSDYAGDALTGQGIRMAEDLYLTTTTLLKTTWKELRYRDPLVVITAIMEYNLYAFHIWTRHRSMRGLVIDLAKFQVGNITAYITY